MRKKILKSTARLFGFEIRRRLLFGAAFFVFLAGTLISSSFGTVQNAVAETVDEYCSKYTSSRDKNACRDGAKANFDCNDYFVTFGESVAKVCRDAASAKKNGTIDGISSTPSAPPASGACEDLTGDLLTACQGGQEDKTCNKNVAQIDLKLYNACAVGAGLDTLSRTPSPTSSGTGACRGLSGDLLSACQGGQQYGQCNQNVAQVDLELYNACAVGAGERTYRNTPSPSVNPFSSPQNYFQVQDQLNQAGNLTEYIDVLHASGQDADVDTSEMPDNTYGSYINGAGKPQSIKVYESECTAQSGAGAAQSAVNQGVNAAGYQQAYQQGFEAAQRAAELAQRQQRSDFNNQSNDDLLDPDNNSGLFGDEGGTDLLGLGSGAQNGYQNGYLSGFQSIFGGSGAGNTDILSSLGSLGGLGGGLQNGLNNGTNSISNFNFSGGGCPAILFFNGGGWHQNDDTSGRVHELGEMQERGYAAFDVTYRLGSSGIYYIFEDVLRGIRHMINNSGMYGIDPSRIAIWGDSAGGSLVARAAASGKSGAKAAVVWSGPTNAYTALFKSFMSFAIGIDHSTCIPTDLAGLANTTDLLAGGSGDVVKYGEGITSNDFSSLGFGHSNLGPLPTGTTGNVDPVSTIFEVLTVAQALSSTAKNAETITQQLQGGNSQALVGSVINLSSQKLIECLDNMNAMSPALFASPETPPTFLAGFFNDQLIDPSQLYEMRDKLMALGVRSEALVLEGDPNATEGGCTQGQSNGDGFDFNHLGFDCRFVCPTLNFLDEILQPGAAKYDCVTGLPEGEEPAADNAGSGGNGGDPGNGGAQESPGGQNPSSNNALACEERKDMVWNGTNCVDRQMQHGDACTLDGRTGTWTPGRRGSFCSVYTEPTLRTQYQCTSTAFTQGYQTGCQQGYRDDCETKQGQLFNDRQRPEGFTDSWSAYCVW